MIRLSLCLCFFFLFNGTYAFAQSSDQDSIRISQLWSLFEAHEYSEALKGIVDVPDSIEFSNGLMNQKLAVLKYYHYRLNNRGNRAARWIDKLYAGDNSANSNKDLVDYVSVLKIYSEFLKGDIVSLKDTFQKKQTNPVLENIVLQLKAIEVSKSFNYDRQLDYIQTALGLMLNSDYRHHPEVVLTLRQLGQLSRKRSEYEKSEQYFQMEWNEYVHLYDSLHVGCGIATYHLGSVCYEKLEYQKAIDYFKHAEKSFVKNGFKSRFMRHLYEAMGDMYFELGLKKEAANYWAHSSVNGTQDEFDKKIIHSDSLILNGEFQKAESVFNEALEFRLRTYGENHALTAECYSYMGRTYIRNNEFQQALEYYHNALKTFIPWFNDSNVNSIPDSLDPDLLSIYLFEAITGKAEALLELYVEDQSNLSFLNSATDHIELGLSLLLELRKQPRTQASGIFWSNLATKLFDTAIEVYYWRWQNFQSTEDLKRAYLFMEHSRSHLLKRAFQNQRFFEVAGVPNEIIEQELELKKKIASFEMKIRNEEKKCQEANQNHIEAWRLSQLDLELEHINLMKKLKDEYRNYYNLKFDDTILEFNEIMEKIGEKDVICSFFLSNSGVFLLVFNANTCDYIHIPGNIDISARIDSFNLFLQLPAVSKGVSIEDRKNLFQLGHTLYKQTIEPVVRELTPGKNITIIPDKKLYELPWPALVRDSIESDRLYNKVPWLVNDFDLSVSPSIQWNYSRFKRIKYKQLYSGWAPAFQNENYTNSTRASYKSLHHNQMEINVVAELFEGDKYLGNHATKASFLDQSSGSRILHCATHASLNNESPMQSNILFSLSQSDSVLYAHEIYNLSTPAELVVLSACETGAGPIQSGEGVISLARAFQFAGCPSILMTQWSVDDQATSRVVRSFFSELSQGSSKKTAISEAQRKYISNSDPVYSHPFYWSGLTLMGNPDPIIIDGNNNLILLALCIVSILLFGLIIKKYRKS